MRNIKLVIEYDGSQYCGWQIQSNDRTVQGELEHATKRLFGETHRLAVAGRTDTGVHALAQVANFKTASDLELRSIRPGLNSYLPEDIVVKEVEQVAESFHARFNATSREYRYVISKRQRAVGRQYAWHCKYDLNCTQMAAASKYLLGTHAFTAFSKIMEEEPHYLCDLRRLEWRETADEFVMEICSNRFLHNMVRSVAGTLVDVGRGRLKPVDLKEILESGDRARAGSAAPPHGLFLVRVNYL